MKSRNTSPGWEAPGRPSRTGSFPSPLRSIPGGPRGRKGLSQAGGRCTDAYMSGRKIVTPVSLFAKPEELSGGEASRGLSLPGPPLGWHRGQYPGEGLHVLPAAGPVAGPGTGKVMASGTKFQGTPKPSVMEVNTILMQYCERPE